MKSGLCIGGIDIGNRRSLRLLPAGAHTMPDDVACQIGDIWDMTYTLRGTAPPFVEDADAVLGRRIGGADVADYVRRNVRTAVGDTSALYEGKLRWNARRKGFIEPGDSPPYSTQFWNPARFLNRYDDDRDVGRFVFWEPETSRRIRWVGVEAPPGCIEAGSLARVSLGRPFAGSEDHDVCWLQLSAAY